MNAPLLQLKIFLTVFALATRTNPFDRAALAIVT